MTSHGGRLVTITAAETLTEGFYTNMMIVSRSSKTIKFCFFNIAEGKSSLLKQNVNQGFPRSWTVQNSVLVFSRSTFKY